MEQSNTLIHLHIYKLIRIESQEQTWNQLKLRAYRVFAGEIRLIEVVHVCHVSPSKTTLKNYGRIRSN